MTKKVLLIALASAILLSSAAAKSVKSTLEGFQFFGKWSPQCGEPPSAANSLRNSFITERGEVRFTESLGSGYQENVYRVLSAKLDGGDKVVLRIELNGKVKQDLTMLKQNGRMRTIINQRIDGQFVVKDGIIVGNGKETPWLSRCGS